MNSWQKNSTEKLLCDPCVSTLSSLWHFVAATLVSPLVVSFIWRKRAIPIYLQRLKTLGNSHLTTQKTALEVALLALSAYKVVVLGDREFCSVDLAGWLGEQQAYFCLRQKKTTHIQPHDKDWIALGELGLTPGTSCFSIRLL